MAKFTPGPAVAAVSGSIGGTVFSRNRGGAYIRNRSVPITSTTTYAQAAKTALANRSQAWAGLTAAQRLAWGQWAKQNPVVDTLGFPRELQGNAAYIQINTRLEAVGESPISDPPITEPPSPLITLTAEGDIGAGDFEINFTATPLGANDILVIGACVVNSAGINYVENLIRQVGYSAAAAASPIDPQLIIEARLGALVVGQTVHYRCFVLDTTTGLISLPLRTRVLVSST